MTIEECMSHNWVIQADQQYACSECPATARACVQCHDALDVDGRISCDRCVSRWQKVVRDVWTWATHFQQDPYSPISSARIDPNRVSTSDDDVRLPFGLDSIVSDFDGGRIESLRNVGDAIDVLATWARRWAATRSEAPPAMAVEYLAGLTLWALEHQDVSAWPEYARDARRVRALVRRLVGIAPEREAAPCVHCGGQIIREWERDGLSELRRCTGCGLEWPEYSSLMHTNHLVLQGLPETHPGLRVTLDDANRIYRGRIAPNLLHMWVKRGKLLAIDRDVRGGAVYMLGHIKEMVDAAEAKKSASGDKVSA